MISLCRCMNYPTIPQLQVPKQMLMWRFFQDFQALASQQSKTLRKSGFFSFLLFSFPHHCMVKSQNYWLFKEHEGKLVKDKQICHSECCAGEKKIQKSTSMGNLKFIFLFWNDFLFWNFTWNRDSKGLPIQVSVVIQLLLIHKMNNFMSCFLILRSLSSIYHYPPSSFLKYYLKHYSGGK